MRTGVTDDVIRVLLRGSCSAPLNDLEETSDAWHLFTFSILKHQPSFNNGWTWALRPESRFYKRWFDFPEMGMRGWAIIFRIFDPVGEPDQVYEHFPGWVPQERESDADRWIDFLNAEIRARFGTAPS